jgi:hypothetical protein
MKRLTRALLGVFLAGALGAGSLMSAHAAIGDLPPDVQAAYSIDALNALRNAEESLVTVDKTGVPDFSAAESFGAPRQVNLWSTELITGKLPSEPTSALEEWLAPILGPAGEVLGTYRVWRATSGGNAELAGYNDDIELGAALQELGDGSVLVSDPAIEAWYVLRDGSVSALNQSAVREVPYPMPVDEVARTIADRYDAAIRNSEQVGDGAAGGMTVEDRRPWYYGMNLWILATGSLVLLASALGGIWWTRAHRRTPSARSAH